MMDLYDNPRLLHQLMSFLRDEMLHFMETVEREGLLTLNNGPSSYVGSGGIGYTNVYPIEKFLRDARLSMIWTGTNEIMNLLIQHEYYQELYSSKRETRDVEFDAINSDKTDEKIFE